MMTRPRSATHWGLGLILYELLAGTRSVGERNILHLLELNRSVDPDRLAGEAPDPFRALLRRMLARDPEARTVAMQEVERVLRDGAAGSPPS